MIILITGSLGAGKTSNTLWDLVYNPKFKGRPKFATYIEKFDYEKCGFEQIDKNDLENWVKWTDPKDDFSTVSNFPKGSTNFIYKQITETDILDRHLSMQQNYKSNYREKKKLVQNRSPL